MLIISFPSNFTANFLMIGLPMLLTNVLFGSEVEVNSTLKLSLVNLTGVVSDNYFYLVPFIPLGVLRECSGFNRFPYSILIGDGYILRSRI